MGFGAFGFIGVCYGKVPAVFRHREGRGCRRRARVFAGEFPGVGGEKRPGSCLTGLRELLLACKDLRSPIPGGALCVPGEVERVEGFGRTRII